MTDITEKGSRFISPDVSLLLCVADHDKHDCRYRHGSGAFGWKCCFDGFCGHKVTEEGEDASGYRYDVKRKNVECFSNGCNEKKGVGGGDGGAEWDGWLTLKGTEKDGDPLSARLYANGVEVMGVFSVGIKPFDPDNHHVVANIDARIRIG